MNSKRVLLIASVLFAITAAFSSLIPTQVHAATTINLDPTSGISGSKSTLTGDGFIGKLATIYWDDKRLVQNIPVSKTGQINFTFEIPASTKGDHIVKVTDDSNWANINATSAFSVKPSVIVEPPWGKPLTTMTIAGTGFAPGETNITTTWDGKPLTKAPATADRSGTWYANFSVPYAPKGEYTISAKGDATKAGEVTDLQFTVAPFCKATPLSGPVGTNIIVTGVGFRAGEDGMTFTWDGPILDTNFVAQPNGSFSVTLVVPPSTKGRHIIGIYGSSFTPKGIVPDIEFEVTSSIKLTPSDLINSRDLLIEGYGFNSTESVAINYDKSSTGISATTDTQGNFSITIQVPEGSVKDHQVIATGSKGALAQANYTSLSISPPTPQLLYPGPGAKIETTTSVMDVMSDMFKYIGGIFEAINGAGQKKNDTAVTSVKWSTTSNETGLKYTLQLSSAANFSNTVFTKDGIQGTAYSLTKSELPLTGTYYWRIKASSITGGESPWSNSWSFELLPTSSLILAISVTILVLIVAAVVFGIIALVNRRRYSN